MTQAIVNGMLYDTETATYVGKIGSDDGFYPGDFKFWEAHLYRTPNGRFFMEGKGGPRSPFAESYGENGWAASRGIRALSTEDALGYAQDIDISIEKIVALFGDAVKVA